MDQTTALNAPQAAGIAAASGAYSLFSLIFAVLSIIALWKIFTKAGEEGWKSIIPIYNTYVLLKIVGRPGWWLLLMLIPLVNIIVLIVVMNDLSKSFGQGVGFTIGLLLLSPVFYLILGFGSSRYVGPGGVAAAAPAAYIPPMAPPAPSAPPAPPAPPVI